MPEQPPLTVSQLAHFHKQLRNREQRLKNKRAKVQAFEGLPPVRARSIIMPLAANLTFWLFENIELARHEVRNARDEQMRLLQLRERLLERMASGVS